MGGVVKKVGQTLGITADEDAGRAEMDRASGMQERMVAELEKIGVPSIEAQQIALIAPELVLSTEEERLGGTAFEDIAQDPRLASAQAEALADLQLAGREGFTAEDMAKTEALRRQAAGDEQARQASILQQMAMRGALDSGAQLAAQLSSSQEAADRQAMEGIQLAAQQAAARRGALSQAGQMAGKQSAQDFSQQAQQARAKDIVAQFNAGVAARDTAARQAQAQEEARIRNRQEIHNKGLIQQQFANEIAKATGMGAALGKHSQFMQNRAAMQAQAAQQEAAGNRMLFKGAATALGGPVGGAVAGAFEDGGLKKMGYEEEGMQTEGRIVPGEQYSGDIISDKINSGEMVINLDQQQRLNDLFKELATLRADVSVDEGMAEVNEPQQEALMDVVRGDREPEQLPEQDVVEQKGLKRLLRTLGGE